MKELNLTNHDNLGIYDFEEFVAKAEGREVIVQHVLNDNYDISKEEEIYKITINTLKETLLELTTDGFVDMIEDCGKYLLRVFGKHEGYSVINEYKILNIA